MAELKYYFDTHVAQAIAEQLRLRGVDAIRCEDVGLADAKDVTHLEYATAHARAVVSHDEDYIALDAAWRTQGKHHGGIFYLQPYLQGNIGQVVKRLYEFYELIEGGAGTVEADIANRVNYIG